MLRVASRDILAPYSPLASKSVRCPLLTWTCQLGQLRRCCIYKGQEENIALSV